jgi:acyl carrier protein
MHFWCSESSLCEQAKLETLSKVCDIVKSLIALSDDKPLTSESKFSDDLGTDSLDTNGSGQR